ncbi:hypothetical protein D3C78_1446780 [compost metagenome]
MVAILPWRLMPSNKSPLVIPVAEKITLSLRAISSSSNTLPASIPISLQRASSSSPMRRFSALSPFTWWRGSRRACISPSSARITAAEMTPSGAPPMPYITSTSLSGIQVRIEAATSPSGIAKTRTPSCCIWAITPS